MTSLASSGTNYLIIAHFLRDIHKVDLMTLKTFCFHFYYSSYSTDIELSGDYLMRIYLCESSETSLMIQGYLHC